MAKKRKTRKEKMLSDLRHQHPQLRRDIPPTEQDSFSFSFQAKHSTPTVVPLPKQSFLFHDLRKTALTTGALLALELALFYGGKFS